MLTVLDTIGWGIYDWLNIHRRSWLTSVCITTDSIWPNLLLFIFAKGLFHTRTKNISPFSSHTSNSSLVSTVRNIPSEASPPSSQHSAASRSVATDGAGIESLLRVSVQRCTNRGLIPFSIRKRKDEMKVLLPMEQNHWAVAVLPINAPQSPWTFLLSWCGAAAVVYPITRCNK